MPSTRPTALRILVPLAASLAGATLACAAAFKFLWPDVPLTAIVIPTAVASALTIAWLLIVLRKRWVGPLRHLVDVTDRLTGGDWTARAELAGADDPRMLADGLNRLAGAAEQQMAALNHQRSDLQQLVDSLPDPILLSDSQQRVILINAAACKVLQILSSQALGKRFMNVVNDVQIMDLFEALSAQTAAAQPMQREIRITRAGQRNYYQGVGTRTTAGGVLIVLRNVTTMASAIQMKTDFVANASHELRTPVSAIKIAFETLREVSEEDPQQAHRCIDIIGGHLVRLEELLRDLLDLSRVETAELKPQLGAVKVASLFALVRQSLGTMARQKNVELVFDGDEDATFNTDRRLLDLSLKNLVENSIKYTPTGGKVTTSIHRRERPAEEGHGRTDSAEVELKIIDTGIGIPPEHLERVFERFYQVDAARTGGANRGTGLGLAIVKHAVHALGGTVDLQSEVGKGTVVSCVLPDVHAAANSIDGPPDAAGNGPSNRAPG